MNFILHPPHQTCLLQRAASTFASKSESKRSIIIKLLLLPLVFLSACSTLPENIRNPPALDIQINQVLQHDNDYKNSPIRWGGSIIKVENEAESSKLQIMAYPLNYYGRPVTSKAAYGRFVAVTEKFLDPVIYSKGTEITVAGIVQKTISQMIGKKTITLPVVVIQNFHVWPKYRQNYLLSPYDYDPYYYGYRPSYYYPYQYYSGFNYYGCY